MRVEIRPGKPEGAMEAPPSKSMAHRMMICAALAEGNSVIRNVDVSEDMLATQDCLTALGAGMRRAGRDMAVAGCRPEDARSAVLNCRESGSTLRFMVPLCLLGHAEMELEGSERLMSRPLSVYEEICQERGLEFSLSGTRLRVRGPLEAGEFTVPGDISSQFITGLLLALPLKEKDSRIRILPPVESRPYLDMTLEAMEAFGVKAAWESETVLRVPGGGSYQPRDLAVEGDWSNAAFFEALNVTGGDVKLAGLREDSLQGDRVCREYLRRIREGTPELDVSDCPDLAPVLMAAAALCRGAKLTGTRRLKIKESDRGAAMAEEMAKFGIRVDQRENGIAVPAGTIRKPAEPLQSHNDHRIAMALSVMCVRTGGIIEGAEAVRKSLPDYWERLKGLGIEVLWNGSAEKTF